LHANAISALRYVILAGCAVVCFGEPLSAKRVAGSVLVAVGIWMIT
jgi:drug/metabolite transporter (DMT)-like permease